MLDSLFNLGANRHFGWQVSLILLTSICFADFTSTDSLNLSSLNTAAQDILYDTGDISFFIHSAWSNGSYYQGSANFNVVDSAVTGLLNKVISKLSFTVAPQSHVYTNDNASFDSVYVHDVRTDDIYDKLGDIQQSINNLTNVFCYSQDYVQSISGINTNFPALFAFLQYDEESSTINYYRNAFYSLYGYTPTTLELYSFMQTSQIFGLGQWLNFASILGIDYYSLPEELQGYYDNVPYPYPYPFTESSIDSISAAKYYQYGTRQLTDVSIGISNLVSSINLMMSNAFDSVQGDYSGAAALNDSLRQPITYDGDTGKVRHSGGIISAVGDLAEDCIETLPSVSTNLVQANTNAIVNLEDNGYSTAMNAIQNATPDTTAGEFDSIVQDLNAEQFTGNLVSILEESTEPCVFSFDLSGFNLVSTPSRNRDIPQGLVNFTLTDVKQTTNGYVNFFCGFMECILCLFFGAMLWNLIFDSAVVFYK